MIVTPAPRAIGTAESTVVTHKMIALVASCSLAVLFGDLLIPPETIQFCKAARDWLWCVSQARPASKKAASVSEGRLRFLNLIYAGGTGGVVVFFSRCGARSTWLAVCHASSFSGWRVYLLCMMASRSFPSFHVANPERITNDPILGVGQAGE